MVLTRKRFSEEAILNILRQVELDLAAGSTVASAIRTAGISDATYYKWRNTNSQKESPMGPFTHTDGHNLPWLIDELVPGEARMIDYVVI